MTSEVEKALKAINQRIKDFEIQGFTESNQYKTLIGALKNSGISLTTSKSGYTTISVKSIKDNTDKQNKLVNLKKSKTLTVGSAKRQAVEILKTKEGNETRKDFTQDELQDVTSMSSDVHEIIKNKAQQLYALATQGIISDVRGNSGRLTYGQMFEIVNLEEISQREREKAMRDYDDMKMAESDMLYVDPFEEDIFD